MEKSKWSKNFDTHTEYSSSSSEEGEGKTIGRKRRGGKKSGKMLLKMCPNIEHKDEDEKYEARGHFK